MATAMGIASGIRGEVVTVARVELGEAFLPCPDCGEDAIPASEYRMIWPGGMVPLWTEDDEADCPGCSQHLVARITGDGEDEWIEAKVEEPEAKGGD